MVVYYKSTHNYKILEPILLDANRFTIKTNNSTVILAIRRPGEKNVSSFLKSLDK